MLLQAKLLPITHNPLTFDSLSSRSLQQKLREKANNQMLKFLQIFQRLHFDLSFADVLLHMPKFASTFKSLLSNKDKLFELANTLLNENCSAVLLKKLPEKLGDPGKFLIPCDFSELDECLALADLGASITYLLFPESFIFSADIVVVDYVRSSGFSIILRGLLLRTARALINVHGEELTFRVNDEAITFNVRHTSRYSYRYDDESVNRIDVIDVTCEEYAQEVLGFSDSSKSGNPPPSLDPIITNFSPSFTPFERDILLLEKLLNNDPSSPLPPKELNFEKLKIIKSSIDNPLELELKDLPSHLEYAFLEDTNKLPVIIAKDLKDDEKAHLLKVLKSHKRAIAWKIFDIKGIDPQFCTHKILMEDYFKPAVQHQRRVNPKILEVIKKEVIKLVDAGLIYPISNSPWTKWCDTNLVLNWEKCHFMVKEGIVLGHKISKNGIEVDRDKVDVIAKLPHPTSVKDHSALKYLLAKQDAKPILHRWILLLQEFDVIIRDKKEAENLAADHMSRLENPHQGNLEKKEINETFPLETLGMISFHGDSSTPWFFDVANYHARNFIVKGMSSHDCSILYT
ncbi:hypothetical protein Tco_0642158 [Tanacetum coccineum]